MSLKKEKDTKIDEVVATISYRVKQGIYVAGQRLPSEREIAEDLGVSRVTVRAALQRLQAENILDVVPRSGTFVRALSRKVTVGPGSKAAKGLELKRAGSFIRAMRATGRNTHVRFIEPSSIIPLGDELGGKMRTHPETNVLRRYRVHLVDNEPYRILDSYYLAEWLGGLLGQDEGYTPLFKWMYEHTGRRAAHAFERINCRMPSAEEAMLLNIARNQPVIDMDRWVRADDGTLFEYSRIIENAALHEHSYEYDIDEGANT